MKFFQISSLFLLSFVALLPSFTVANYCSVKKTGANDKVGLHNCLKSLRHDDIDGKHCGSQKWFMATPAWHNNEECFNRCLTCLNDAIEAGATHVSCRQRKVFGHCHMGFE